MHSIRFPLAGLAAAMLLAGCASSKTTQRSPSLAAVSGDQHQSANAGTSESQEVVLTVHGMSCPLCASNVDKQLLKIPGVEGVKVNLNTGIVRVQVSKDQPPLNEKLVKAIEESGFTLVGQPQQR